ncbi:MAG: Flp pilus assembly complex ATPase component TadA, partial [Acidobacteria bacterium]|nr:Flp pilus assembly complex ATPase component TadA [Acidobacteriota bacterium]
MGRHRARLLPGAFARRPHAHHPQPRCGGGRDRAGIGQHGRRRDAGGPAGVPRGRRRRRHALRRGCRRRHAAGASARGRLAERAWRLPHGARRRRPSPHPETARPARARTRSDVRMMPPDAAPIAPQAAPSPASPTQGMDALLTALVRLKASDLHLSAGCVPTVRLDGEMTPVPGAPVIGPADTERLLLSIAPPRAREEFGRRHDTDFAYEIAGVGRFRGNLFVDRKGPGGVFRIIPTKILTAEELGLAPELLDLCRLPKGLVLVTGPTGSGKSTTLCALVDYINRTRTDHIITIEDPLEFIHENKQCLVNQRQVGDHTDSFKDALRAALREDPDIVLVGELRDLDTMAMAIETAET